MSRVQEAGCSKSLIFSPAQPRRSFPPTRPPSASHSITRDAPFRVRGRSEHPKMFFHTCLDTFSSDGLDESPTARPLLTHPPWPRRDASSTQRGPSFSVAHFCALTQGSGQIMLHCARRTTTASSWGFREQEEWSGRSLLIILRPRVARAQGTHQAISPPAGGIFQQPASWSDEAG